MLAPEITTYTGRKVNPLDLRVEDICVEDIAHHLACINRWVGATREPINVAHHSVYVSYLVEGTGWEREALFHDATEAYLGDVSRWVKRDPAMAAYREAEDRAWSVIAKALGLREELDPVVEEADRLMVRFEAAKGFDDCHLFKRETHPRPTVGEIERVHQCMGRPWFVWGWQYAKYQFHGRDFLTRNLHKKPNKNTA